MPVVSGRRDADAILVGQAPGVREADNLTPFSGPAGPAAAGVARARRPRRRALVLRPPLHRRGCALLPGQAPRRQRRAPVPGDGARVRALAAARARAGARARGDLGGDAGARGARTRRPAGRRRRHRAAPGRRPAAARAAAPVRGQPLAAPAGQRRAARAGAGADRGAAGGGGGITQMERCERQMPWPRPAAPIAVGRRGRNRRNGATCPRADARHVFCAARIGRASRRTGAKWDRACLAGWLVTVPASRFELPSANLIGQA